MDQLNKKHKAFYRRVAEILWEDWDPIGLNDGDNTWNDEYDSYAPHVFRLAMEGKDAQRIADSLSLSVTQNMGLGANKENNLQVARTIIENKLEMLG